MSMHTRAFGEMHILIYGQDPLVPMKLEQTFAQARPADEIRFDSFEDYDQAYDFAKENKSVGLVFLLENCGEMDLNSVYKQFSKLGEQQDTCFGVLIHDGQESFKGLRAMKDNDHLIAYYDVNDLLDADKAPFLLKEIWEKYQEAFEKQVIPSALAQTYRSMALLHVNEEELSFRQRLCTLLTGEMNVSWKEGFLLKWHPVLEVLQKDEGNVLHANKTLTDYYAAIKPTAGMKDITAVANGEMGVAQKVATATSILGDVAQAQGLETFLQETLANVSPRSKALLRTMKRHQDRIVEFSQTSTKQQAPRLLKVV